MSEINFEHGRISIPEQKSGRPEFASELTDTQYNNFLKFYLKHAMSYNSLKEREEYSIDKVTEVRVLGDGKMIMSYSNGNVFRFDPHYA